MKKLKYILPLLFLIFITGCEEVELPKEGSKCTWYINDQYTEKTDNETLINTNMLFYSLEDDLDLSKNPRIEFYYNSSSDYGVKVLGLNSDVEVEYLDHLQKSGRYEITIAGKMAPVRLSFNFTNYNIKSSGSDDTCPYPTLYYTPDNTATVITTYNFSTQYQDSYQPNFINIYNSLGSNNLDPNNPIKPDIPDYNWCSTYYNLHDKTFKKDYSMILYFWEQETDKIVYAIQPTKELANNDNLAFLSKFSTSYAWNSTNDPLKYQYMINSMDGVLIEFESMTSATYKDSDGKLVCMSGTNKDSDFSMITGTYDPSEVMMTNGDKFKRLLSELQPYLIKYAGINKFNPTKYAQVNINNELKSFPWVDGPKELNNVNDDEIEYLVRQKMASVREYCNYMYTNYEKYKSSGNINTRFDECISFDAFYNKGAQDNLFDSYDGDCPFITTDLRDKIVWFLDLMKIAAPIIALALGTFDFIKTIAAGDADKELKSTFKKFMIRIGSAILLFVIPIILAFILDLFLENQDGYNDPFCKIIDWNEVK